MEIKDINHAIGILINAAKVACKHGAFELEDAGLINSAIELIKSSSEEDKPVEKAN